MNGFNFDFKQLLDMKIESEMLKNKQAKPLVLLLKKYGITGMRAISFMAELATVTQQLQNGADDE